MSKAGSNKTPKKSNPFQKGSRGSGVKKRRVATPSKKSSNPSTPKSTKPKKAFISPSLLEKVSKAKARSKGSTTRVLGSTPSKKGIPTAAAKKGRSTPTTKKSTATIKRTPTRTSPRKAKTTGNVFQSPSRLSRKRSRSGKEEEDQPSTPARTPTVKDTPVRKAKKRRTSVTISANNDPMDVEEDTVSGTNSGKKPTATVSNPFQRRRSPVNTVTKSPPKNYEASPASNRPYLANSQGNSFQYSTPNRSTNGLNTLNPALNTLTPISLNDQSTGFSPLSNYNASPYVAASNTPEYLLTNSAAESPYRQHRNYYTTSTPAQRTTPSRAPRRVSVGPIPPGPRPLGLWDDVGESGEVLRYEQLDEPEFIDYGMGSNISCISTIAAAVIGIILLYFMIFIVRGPTSLNPVVAFNDIIRTGNNNRLMKVRDIIAGKMHHQLRIARGNYACTPSRYSPGGASSQWGMSKSQLLKFGSSLGCTLGKESCEQASLEALAALSDMSDVSSYLEGGVLYYYVGTASAIMPLTCRWNRFVEDNKMYFFGAFIVIAILGYFISTGRRKRRINKAVDELVAKLKRRCMDQAQNSERPWIAKEWLKAEYMEDRGDINVWNKANFIMESDHRLLDAPKLYKGEDFHTWEWVGDAT